MVMTLCPFFVMALTEDPTLLWSRFRDSGLIAVPIFFEAAQRQNQPLPSTTDIFLSVSKVQNLKLIRNSLRCLLMLHGKRNGKKKHQITASDEGPGGLQ